MTPGRRAVSLLAAAALCAGGVAAGVVASQGGGRPVQTPSSSSGPTTSGPTTSSPSTTTTTAPPGSAGAPAAPPPHVMVIVMENHGYDAVIGNPTAPYINSLAQRYGLATASFATTHPSLPNYLALVSGSTQGITSDCTTCTAPAPQLADQLQQASVPWGAYIEAMPRPCGTGGAPLPYDRHHNPFVYDPSLTADPAACDRIVPYAALGPQLAAGAAPDFIWVTPDVRDDMHTGTVAQGDAWLRGALGAVLASSWYADGGVVIVTWDEGTTDAGCCGGAAGGRVATLVVSGHSPAGARLSTPLDGAGILRTIEALYGLPFLGAAADPASGTLMPLLGRPPVTG